MYVSRGARPPGKPYNNYPNPMPCHGHTHPSQIYYLHPNSTSQILISRARTYNCDDTYIFLFALLPLPSWVLTSDGATRLPMGLGI